MASASDLFDKLGGEINTGFGVFDDLPLDELIKAFTGQTAAEAARLAGEEQIRFSEEALDLFRGDLEPFRGLISPDQARDISTFASDPEAQASFLRDNPLFEGMKEQIRQDVFNRQSAGGALGSSGTDEILANQFLQAGNALISQQANRALPLLNTAQAAAAQQGAGSANLLTGIGNALAGGRIGAANAEAQGTENLTSALSSIAGLFA